MSGMDGMLDPNDPRLTQAWDILKAQKDLGLSLEPESNRLAFADPEFLLRRETRGIRFQLELLKPDLEMQARGIEHTVVVFGSARYRSQEAADQLLKEARLSGDDQAIQRATITSRHASSAPGWCNAANCNRHTNVCTFAPGVAPASWRRPTGGLMKQAASASV
jgi:hypothetical protein